MRRDEQPGQHPPACRKCGNEIDRSSGTAGGRQCAAEDAPLIAAPHIGGSMEEAQETAGVRIVEQVIDGLENSVAINSSEYGGTVV